MFDLFNSTRTGLIGLDQSNRILEVNDSCAEYLGVDVGNLLTKDLTVLQRSFSHPPFWEAVKTTTPFSCLMPGANHIFLAICRSYNGSGENPIRRVIILRPYGLEREFIRMQSRLSQNVVLEISSHLSSIAIASEIILEPELREEGSTRDRFLKTFLGDIKNVSDLFHELQDIAEPVAFPTRAHFAAVDWKALVGDLLSKFRGLASERNVSIASSLTSDVASPHGDYSWLYLAVFTLLSHAVNEASPMSEVHVRYERLGEKLETYLVYSGSSGGTISSWPPATLFPLAGEDAPISAVSISHLALARAIFQLHRGDVDLEESSETVRLKVTLPL